MFDKDGYMGENTYESTFLFCKIKNCKGKKDNSPTFGVLLGNLRFSWEFCQREERWQKIHGHLYYLMILCCWVFFSKGCSELLGGQWSLCESIWLWNDEVSQFQRGSQWKGDFHSQLNAIIIKGSVGIQNVCWIGGLETWIPFPILPLPTYETHFLTCKVKLAL